MGVVWEAVGFTLVPHVGGIAGTLVTRQNNLTWYKNLKKPWWLPTDEVKCIPIWMGLYSGMGYASYLVYRETGGFHGDGKLPLALYGSQLALNWAWPPIFFGMQSLKWGAVEIVVLAGAVAATTVAFHKVNPLAAYLMLPYLAAVSFSSAITIKLYRLNSKQIPKQQVEAEEKPKEK